MSDTSDPNGPFGPGGNLQYQAPRPAIRPRVPVRQGTSGYDRAEQNRFRTLSEINQRSGSPILHRGENPQLAAYDPMVGYTQDMATPGGTDAFIRANYPYMASFLGHPEVGPILRRAAQEGWDESRLYGAVQATSWWQSTSQSARAWEMLVAEDPSTAKAQAAETAANLQNRARSLGLNMSTGQLQSLAVTATKNGWTDNQVVDELLRNLNWASVQAGDLTAIRDTVKSIGAQYLVNVSDSTAQQYAAAIASGEMSEAGVASVMQRSAKQRFTWMADEIDQGITPSQALMPIRDTIASELEVAPEAVNMMDPKWMGMIEVAGENGERRGATLNEARLAARKDPMWQGTRGAQELMTKASSAIRDVFGRRAV